MLILLIIWRDALCFKKSYVILFIFLLLMPLVFLSIFFVEKNNYVYTVEEIIGNKSTEKKRIIKIAIVDSGINRNEELDDKVAKSYNAINDSSKTFDEYNHGTPVAGIVAGNTIGVNPKVQLYDVQFLGQDGNGQLEHLIKGIEWAIREEVDIINISSGFQNSNTELEEVITKANKHNILVISAAGNTYGFGVEYPAGLSNVFSIGSVNKDLSKAYFSGEGKIDFVTLGTNLKSITNKGKYENFDGTSFSAAYFTGMISLLISEISDKEGAYQFITNELENYGYDLGVKGLDEKYGNGLILIKE
ncbi:S8 family peptidase [Aeribacillus composti]|jgi:subtilisin family serine protease|uniref:S8 family peptidase n=1 Tax=Aeribacillus composti TaxID=1868734 RepID=UPI0011993F8C|nr:S8 family serine peptidase [Aeribacillus composti]MDR9794870.1 S8 family serine peptidase [Aeribacillus pallidus]MED0714210.1 S8 family serine peptidase [Aeribacillus composti]TVZ76027.1 minor extracellular protease Epr [Aeribacillus composti]